MQELHSEKIGIKETALPNRKIRSTLRTITEYLERNQMILYVKFMK